MLWTGQPQNGYGRGPPVGAMARVPLLDAEDLPEEYRYLLSESEVGEADIFRAMAHAPEEMRSYMRYATTLWDVLPVRERELAILAVARVEDARYEWHHHVGPGREAGLTDEEIDALASGDLDRLDADDAAIAAYAQAVASETVTDTLHERLRAATDTQTVVGVAMLAAIYVATARMLAALGVEPEEPFVGWESS